MGFAVTGKYEFEDSNLDLYTLHEYKQTSLYHGLNREDEFYNSAKNLKKPISRRCKPWPDVDEFWKSEKPVEFRLLASHLADHRKFKRWLVNHLRKIEGSNFDFDAESLARHQDTLDICLGDYDKIEKVNTDMAVYKWTNQYFMSPDEIKKLPEDKKM